MAIMVFLSFCFAFILYNILSSKIVRLHKKVTKLEYFIKNKLSSSDVAKDDVLIKETNLNKEVGTKIVETATKNNDTKKALISNDRYNNKSTSEKVVSSAESYFLTKIIGIIGIITLVVGIVFLSAYSAIFLGPLARFIMIVVFSVVCYGLFIFFDKKKIYQNFSKWVRSASGIIFMAGCFASIYVTAMNWAPEYLKWPLLTIGIGFNLFCGFASKKQIFTCLHTLLSFLILVLLPFNYTIFIAASIIIATSSFVMITSRWTVHLFVSLITYTVCHIYWTTLYLDSFPKILSIAIIILVSTLLLIIHYRKQEVYHWSMLLVRFASWLCLGVNLMPYYMNNWISTVALIVATIISFGLSAYALSKEYTWIYICDRVASLALLIATIFSFGQYGFNFLELLFLITSGIAVYIYLLSKIVENIVFKIANILLVIGCLLMLCIIAINSADFFIPVDLFIMSSLKISTRVICFIMAAFAILLGMAYLVEKGIKKNNLGFNVFGEQTSLLFCSLSVCYPLIASYLLITDTLNVQLTSLVIYLFVGLVLSKKLISSKIVDVFSIIGTVIISFAILVQLLLEKFSIEYIAVMSGIIILMASINLATGYSPRFKQNITWPFILIIWLLLMILSYIFFRISYPTLTGVLWLIISLVCSELRNWKSLIPIVAKWHNRSYLTVTILGVFSLVLYIVRFYTVDIDNYALAFDIVRLRIFSELFSAFIVVSWIYSLKKDTDTRCNFMLDVLVFLTLSYVMLEVQPNYQLILGSFVILILALIGKKNYYLSRLVGYAYLFYFVTVVGLGIIVNSYKTPSELLTSVYLVIYLIAAVFLIIFNICIYRQNILISFLNGFTGLINSYAYPKDLSTIKTKEININKRLCMRYLVYPLTISLAFFCYCGFSNAYLSLLWLLECFVLFVLSLVFIDYLFCRTAMLGVLFICFRVAIHDLKNENLLIRSLILIGVGVILILMNLIYTKYQSKYKENL